MNPMTSGSIRDLLRTIGPLAAGRIPGQLVIQMTDHCNARCPQCGMRVTERFPRSRLATDEIKGIIDGAAEKGVRAVSFTGGEPLLHLADLAELIRHAGAAGIDFIRTGTNGFLFADPKRRGFRSRVERVVDTLAATPLRNFWISIDSAVAEVHERMRGFPGVVAGIEQALPLFHERGLYPSVNLGINRNIAGDGPDAVPDCGRDPDRFFRRFRRAFRRFYAFAVDLGFTMVNSCYPMSIDPESEDLDAVYAATSADRVVRFTGREKVLLFRALSKTIPEFRSSIRIFSPRVSLLALERQYAGAGPAPYPCKGGIDFLFIQAGDGKTYPCGYRGDEPLGRFQDLRMGALSDSPPCRRCDWECFRDPSELFGPILEGVSAPGELLRRFFRDPGQARLWMEDLLYYRACDFFDGRQPMNPGRLQRFSPAAARGNTDETRAVPCSNAHRWGDA